jgi:mycothione reductase
MADLAIIGSGSGNSIVPEDRSVVLVEKDPQFGGTCLNYGCIPTKMFVRSAEMARTPEEAQRLNVASHTDAVDWDGLRDRVFQRVDNISSSGKHFRAEEAENVELVDQHVTLTGGTGFVADDGTHYSPTQLVIAAGSRATIPDFPGNDLVHTSDTIMRLDDQPERILILGSGFVACEFAGIFSGLGSSVTQVVRTNRVMKAYDEEISEAFTKQAAKNWNLVQNVQLGEVKQLDASSPQLTCFDSNGDKLGVFDAVLVATGRKPNTDLLRAQDAGFDLHDDGRLIVDEYLRVLSGGAPVEGVFALGDICSKDQLKHVANHQARVVSHNLEHPEDMLADGTLPIVSAAFSYPELARVGLTEREAKKHYSSVTAYTQNYGDTAYGWALEDATGLFKVVADKDSGKILGADIMGYEASVLIQPIVMAMSFGISAYDAARGQYWPHPALTEVTENALLGLEVPKNSRLV